MRTLIILISIIIPQQIYAGDLIILDRYYLEKSENDINISGTEHARKNESGERSEKKIIRGEEVSIDAKNEDRNINNYVIKKSKHQIKNAKDSPFLEYQF